MEPGLEDLLQEDLLLVHQQELGLLVGLQLVQECPDMYINSCVNLIVTPKYACYYNADTTYNNQNK